MSGAAELAAELLAHPREAGTPEAARVRTLVSHRLRALGYVVEEQPFVFSPASLYAFPVLGAGLGWLALVLLPLLAAPAPPRWAAIAVWMAGLLALGMIVCGLGVGWAPPGSPARQDANLIATRGPGVVRRWIVAHADTKAQGHSMAGRLVAVWIVTLAVAVETALAVARLGGPVPIAWVAAGAGLLVAAGFLAGRGRLRGGSRGARDNGSGLVAALLAAERSRDPGVGIVITGAEEFGLVGARVFARTDRARLEGTEVVNLDTIDDRGRLHLVAHDARGLALAGRLGPALGRLGVPLRIRRLPLGILTDSLPLARAGARAVTVARLDWSTLRRIHTPGDTLDGFSLETATRLAELVADGLPSP